MAGCFGGLGPVWQVGGSLVWVSPFFVLGSLLCRVLVSLGGTSSRLGLNFSSGLSYPVGVPVVLLPGVGTCDPQESMSQPLGTECCFWGINLFSCHCSCFQSEEAF